jgi:arginine deiminase
MESKLNAHTKVDNNHMTGPSFNLKKIYDFAVKKAETSFEEDMWKDVILDMKSALESNYDDIKDSEGRKGAVYEVRPKNNLMFMRDQQFMGDKGYIMCNMKKPARKYPLGKERGEPQVTEIALEQIVGEGPIFKVRGNNTIEGGEYIPCGEFALVGYGSRSNIEAIESVLSAKNEKGERVLGFDKVIAVKTPDAKEVGRGEDMEIMHLDTYFNFAGEGRVVVQPDVAKGTELTEYVLEDGKYVKKGAPKVDGQECKTLWDFIKAKKYKTVELSPLEQRYYGANVLTLDKDNVLVPKIGLHSDKVSTEKYLQKFYDADLKPENVIQLEMKELTKAYGCIHCLTCPIERIPYEQLKKNV